MQAYSKPSVFPQKLSSLGHDPLIVCHNDADGLSAGVILARALKSQAVSANIRIIGKGENAYSPEFRLELENRQPSGLIIADLGVSATVACPGVPTIVIDHHVPTGMPENTVVISGIDDDPVPTSSLLAFRCADALGAADGLLWLAALGIIGDMAEKSGFPELEHAKASYGITHLRKATALINAPRRSASGDASAAFALLCKADGPKDVLSGEYPETQALLSAKQEIQDALNAARKVGPRFSGDVAMITFASACQIHPLIAQQWRGRLKNKIIIAANTGYRPGWVHFAVRASMDCDILAFLADHRPKGATEHYGNGHRAASGGALRHDDWNFFVSSLGFEQDRQLEKANVQ